MCIITGPREDLAIGLIDRMEGLFVNHYQFDTKETVIELNGVHIEAYPSNHLDAAKANLSGNGVLKNLNEKPRNDS